MVRTSLPIFIIVFVTSVILLSGISPGSVIAQLDKVAKRRNTCKCFARWPLQRIKTHAIVVGDVIMLKQTRFLGLSLEEGFSPIQ